MIRSLIIVCNLAIAFIVNILSGTPSGEVKAPSAVKAGESFVVEVTIQTNGETDFMRYSMDLPDGWTAEKITTDGASFKFEKHTVKFLWSRVGEVPQLKISYRVNVPATAASGSTSLTCKLSHTVDNLPSNIELTPHVITVEGGTAATTSTVSPDSTAKPPVNVTVSRTVPMDPVNGEFLVDIIVNKGDLSSFGKIQDTLPEGFTAKVVKSDGADFEFKNGVVRFSWYAGMPKKPSLNVQYSVVVSPDMSGTYQIPGHFSYVEDNNGKVVMTETSNVNIKSTEAIVRKDPDTQQGGTTQDPNTQQGNTQQGNTQTAQSGNTQQGGNTEQGGTTQQGGNKMAGVNYSVQIAAMRRMVPVAYYQQTYNIPTVNAEQLEGLNKYTTGSFDTYQSARDHRETIRAKGVEGPFVAAYNSGKRITVQEALMITSQKWIR